MPIVEDDKRNNDNCYLISYFTLYSLAGLLSFSQERSIKILIHYRAKGQLRTYIRTYGTHSAVKENITFP